MLKLHFYNHKTLRHLKKQSFYLCCKCCLCKAYSPDTFQTHLVYNLYCGIVSALYWLDNRGMYTIPRQYLYCEQATSGSIVSALYRLDIRCIVYDTVPMSILCANNIRPIYKLYYSNSIVSALYRLDIRCTIYTILGQYPYCVQTIITQYWANTCMYRKRIPIQYRANFTLFPG